MSLALNNWAQVDNFAFLLLRDGESVLRLDDGSLRNLFQMVGTWLSMSGRVHRDPICGFLVFWLQIATQSAFYVNLYRDVIGPSG